MTPPTREQFDTAAETIKAMSVEQKDLLLSVLSFAFATFLSGDKIKASKEAFTGILTEQELEVLKSL